MVDLTHEPPSRVEPDGEDDDGDPAGEIPGIPLSEAAEQLLEQASLLSVCERCEIARLLYESVADDDEDPAEVEGAWAEEIKRRVEEIRTGAVETIPAEEVFAEMRARFG